MFWGIFPLPRAVLNTREMHLQQQMAVLRLQCLPALLKSRKTCCSSYDCSVKTEPAMNSSDVHHDQGHADMHHVQRSTYGGCVASVYSSSMRHATGAVHKPIVHRHLGQLRPIALQPLVCAQIKGALHILIAAIVACSLRTTFTLLNLHNAFGQRHIPATVEQNLA